MTFTVRGTDVSMTSVLFPASWQSNVFAGLCLSVFLSVCHSVCVCTR